MKHNYSALKAELRLDKIIFTSQDKIRGSHIIKLKSLRGSLHEKSLGSLKLAR